MKKSSLVVVSTIFASILFVGPIEASPKCFTHDRRLVALSPDGKRALFLDYDGLSYSLSAGIRALDTNKLLKHFDLSNSISSEDQIRSLLKQHHLKPIESFQESAVEYSSLSNQKAGGNRLSLKTKGYRETTIRLPSRWIKDWSNLELIKVLDAPRFRVAIFNGHKGEPCRDDISGESAIRIVSQQRH